ncbi:elongation factor 1 delta, partial [Aphelenchoides avenae]
DKTSKKDKKGKGTGGHDDEDSQNPLSAAINAVKNTVSSVLGVGSQGSVSNAEVDELRKAVDTLKLDNESLRKEVSELRKLVEKVLGGDKSTTKAAAPAKKETEAAAGGDDDFDLFGSDEEEESEEAKQVREKRLADYAAKKAKKPGPIAKSNIIYDVKPWDDTIDVKDIETKVREIEKDGLVWGASKILPVAFGIKKLQ